MKNFGNRIGNKKETLVDARDLLKAKRGNDDDPNFRLTVDARSVISRRDNSRPKLDFTIPTKTINNDTFKKRNPENINNDSFIKRNSESANFSIRKPNDFNYNSNKIPNRGFSDPKISQGIFSRSMERSSPSYPKTFDTRSSRPIVNTKRISNEYIEPIRNTKRNGSEYIEPIRNTKRNGNEYIEPIRNTIRSSNAYIEPIRNTKRNSNEYIEPREFEKRPRSDNIETIKFTVVNEEKGERPALSTAKFNCHKSLVSPIQGYRIEIKNLHPQVNVDDVYELFTSLSGDLRSCNLIRPGYAEVVFRTLVDAQKSIEEFHGRELDGKPMNLKLVTPAQEPSVQSVNIAIQDKISNIQTNRRPAANTGINKDAIYRSMYLKSANMLHSSRKPFKFAVTL